MPPTRPEEEAEAFLQWADEFKQDYKKVAQAYDISMATAYSWGRKYGWKERRRKMLESITQPAFDEAMLEMRLIASAATLRLRTIIESSEDDVALQAIRLWTQLNIQTDMRTDTSVPLTLIDARQIHMHDELGQPGEQRSVVPSKVAHILSANVMSADEEKKTKPRRTWG